MELITRQSNDNNDPDGIRQYYDLIITFLNDSLERAKKCKETGDIRDISTLDQYQNIDLTPIEANYQRIRPRTILNYRGPQFRFLEWTRTTTEINSVYPWIVTPKRALLFLNTSLQRSNRSGVPVGKSTRDCEIAAIIDLFTIQKSFISNYPDLRDPAEPKLDSWPDNLRNSTIKNFLQATSNRDRDLRRITGQDQVSGTRPEGYTQEQLLELAKVTLPEKGPNLWFSMISSQSLMLRGDNRLYWEKTAIYFATHRSKVNRTGRAQYSGALRHKNPLLCTHSALAFNFFRRFHTKKNRKSEPPIDFSSPRNYYYIKLFRGTVPTKSLSPNRADILIRTQLKKVGLCGQKITHVFRGSAARHCVELGASEDSVKIFGRWARQEISDNYLTTVPETPMHILAGFLKDEPYFINRERLDPPESLCRNIFPFINEFLDALNNGTLDTMLTPTMQPTPSASPDNLNSTLEINNNDPVFRDNPALSDALQNPENVGPINYFHDDETSDVSGDEMTDDEDEPAPPTNRDSSLPQEAQSDGGTNGRTYYNDAIKVKDAVILMDYLRRVLIQDFDIIRDYLPTDIARHRIFKSMEYKSYVAEQRLFLSKPLPPEIQEQLDNPKTSGNVCDNFQTDQEARRDMAGGFENTEKSISDLERLISSNHDEIKASISHLLKALSGLAEMLIDSDSQNATNRNVALRLLQHLISSQVSQVKQKNSMASSLSQILRQTTIPTLAANGTASSCKFEARVCSNIREYIADYHALEAKRVEFFEQAGETKVHNISNFRKYQRRKRIYNVAVNLVKAGKTMEEAIDILQEDFINSKKNLDTYSDLKKDELYRRHNVAK